MTYYETEIHRGISNIFIIFTFLNCVVKIDQSIYLCVYIFLAIDQFNIFSKSHWYIVNYH